MNTYVTGAAIRDLREKRGITQNELAEQIGVSNKTISKWETARGLPDISLLQPLAAALGVSVIELMNGEPIVNRNLSANMLRTIMGQPSNTCGLFWRSPSVLSCLMLFVIRPGIHISIGGKWRLLLKLSFCFL